MSSVAQTMTAADADHRALLGDDLSALIREQGLQLSGIEPLARLDAPAHRSAAFCLRLADGGRLKARRCWDAQRAERIAWFLRQLAPLGFPVVRAQQGRALLLDWVPGRVLSSPTDNDDTKAAALLQGCLHRFELPTECPYRVTQEIAAIAVGIGAAIARLKEAGTLTTTEGDAITRLAARHRPTRAATGIIHTDLCPPNLVRGADGGLHPIDNESLRIGYLDLDLARTWYRWPLEGAGGAVFLASYRRARDSRAFIDHFPFWYASVVLGSAVYRLGSPSRAWEVPLACVRALLANPTGTLAGWRQ